MEGTWASRELPVLKAAVALTDEMHIDGRYPDARDISARTQLDIRSVATALNALDGDYLDLRRTAGDLEAWGVPSVTSRARREVGQWPNAESLITQLAAGMTQAAERESDPEQKRRLMTIARGLGSFARDVAVSVAAQALGQPDQTGAM
jgi:hypothetical protein